MDFNDIICNMSTHWQIVTAAYCIGNCLLGAIKRCPTTLLYRPISVCLFLKGEASHQESQGSAEATSDNQTSCLHSASSQPTKWCQEELWVLSTVYFPFFKVRLWSPSTDSLIKTKFWIVQLLFIQYINAPRLFLMEYLSLMCGLYFFIAFSVELILNYLVFPCFKVKY